MGNHIKNIQCVNPQHIDSIPSMAVYYHKAKEKVQVHCFACGYYAWLNPVELEEMEGRNIPTSRSALTKHMFKYIKFYNKKEIEDNLRLFFDFFYKRNMHLPYQFHISTSDKNESYVSLYSQRIRMGELVQEIEGEDITRPFMRFELTSKRGNVLSYQYRFLDSDTSDNLYAQKKKTFYLPINGYYAKIAWIVNNISSEVIDTLVIAESYVDCLFTKRNLFQKERPFDCVTTLGTTTGKVNDIVTSSGGMKQYNNIYLLFDGDEPGMEMGESLYKIFSKNHNVVIDYTMPGKKVYELPIR